MTITHGSYVGSDATLLIRSRATKIEMHAIFSKNLMKNMCLLRSTESIK